MLYMSLTSPCNTHGKSRQQAAHGLVLLRVFQRQVRSSGRTLAVSVKIRHRARALVKYRLSIGSIGSGPLSFLQNLGLARIAISPWLSPAKHEGTGVAISTHLFFENSCAQANSLGSFVCVCGPHSKMWKPEFHVSVFGWCTCRVLFFMSDFKQEKNGRVVHTFEESACIAPGSSSNYLAGNLLASAKPSGTMSSLPVDPSHQKKHAQRQNGFVSVDSSV